MWIRKYFCRFLTTNDIDLVRTVISTGFSLPLEASTILQVIRDNCSVRSKASCQDLRVKSQFCENQSNWKYDSVGDCDAGGLCSCLRGCPAIPADNERFVGVDQGVGRLLQLRALAVLGEQILLYVSSVRKRTVNVWILLWLDLM